MEYWIECVSIALEEAGVSASQEQINHIANAVQGGHENYGMAHGYDAIPNPVKYQAERDLEELRKEVSQRKEWEQSTKPCEACITIGAVKDGWGRDIDCFNCGGKGRI